MGMYLGTGWLKATKAEKKKYLNRERYRGALAAICRRRVDQRIPELRLWMGVLGEAIDDIGRPGCDSTEYFKEGHHVVLLDIIGIDEEWFSDMAYQAGVLNLKNI